MRTNRLFVYQPALQIPTVGQPASSHRAKNQLCSNFNVISLAILILITCLLSGTVAADIGQIKSIEGDVSVIRDGQPIVATVGNGVEQQDVIETGDASSIGIIFVDNSLFASGPNSRIELKRFQFNSTTHEGEFVTSVEQGTLVIESGQIAKQNKEAMKVELPSSVLAVRGTRFLVEVQ